MTKTELLAQIREECAYCATVAQGYIEAENTKEYDRWFNAAHTLTWVLQKLARLDSLD